MQPPQGYPPYQIPPPPQPKKKRPVWVTLAFVVGGVLLLCSCVLLLPRLTTQMGSEQTTPTASSQKGVLSHGTATTTIKASPTNTSSSGLPAPAPGPTTLGQPLSHFLSHYGTPTIVGNPQSGDYSWNHSSLDAFALKPEHYLVNAILFAGNDGNGWNSVQEAVAACRAFLPDDATYKRTIAITNPNPEDQRVYVSPSLASLFPASRFTDENGNVTTPGTFAVVYGYDLTNTTHVNQCSVQIGLEGK